jgi:tetratricopeptide (TPR) repeat protein
LGAIAADGDSYVSTARRLAESGDWARAEQRLRQHLQAQPRDPEAVVLHAEALIHLSQPFDAVLELEQFLSSVPDDVPALKLYAALLLDVMNEPGSAEKTFRRAVELAPKDWQAWEGWGRILLGQHKPADAVRCLRTASDLVPANADVASELARAMEDLDDPAQAEAAHRRALKLNTALSRPLPGVYIRFAAFLSDSDRARESLDLLDKALALDPRSADALYRRAAVREKLGRLREAEADALAALRVAPARRDVRQLLIRTYRSLGDNAKVEEQVAAVRKLADAEQAELARFREMRASLNPAERLLAEGRFREAIAPYEKVVQLVPTFYEAWFALGVCYSQADDSVRAEAALKRYLEFQPLSPDGHSVLGLLLVSMNRTAEARAELSRALELNPDLDEPRAALAKLALDSRDYHQALSLLEPVFARSEGADASAYSLAASALHRLGRRDEALARCEEGLKRFPDSVSLEEIHASFLIACGRAEVCRKRALEWYTRRPASPRYLRCVAELLVMNQPLADATEPVVRKVVAAAPAEASSHYLLAKWARARSQFQLARDEAIRAGALAAKDDDAMRMQCFTLEGIAREALGDSATAEAAYQKGWEINRRLAARSPESAMWYVQFLLDAGRYQDGAARIGEVLTWDAKYGPAYFARARVLDDAGRREEAAREAELSLRYGIDDNQQLRAAHALLAKIYFALGREKEAGVHQAWVRAH